MITVRSKKFVSSAREWTKWYRRAENATVIELDVNKGSSGTNCRK